MLIYDITLPMDTRLAVWPGDTEFELKRKWEISEGSAVNLGSVTMSLHTGTHADAPLHTDAEGESVGSLDLAPFIGAARVIDLSGLKSIPKSVFESFDLAETPRVLLKTGAWKNYSLFPESFPVIEADVPEYLHSKGVVLLGLDAPSVDEFHSKSMTSHHALNRFRIRILESLYLEKIPEGTYELIALPLKLCGGDGSPVRAALRTL